jgi:hypothetical protein
VERAASGALGPARRGRSDRLGAGFFGLGERAGQKGGQKVGKNATDRGKPGSKRHVVSDRGGVPLAVVLTAAIVYDSKVLEEAVDAVEPIKRPLGKPGRPRKRPVKLHADKAYEFDRCRKAFRKRGIKARIARRGIDSSEKLGRRRGGWWSARWHGSPATAGCRCATSAETTSTRLSSNWAARSSASTT